MNMQANLKIRVAANRVIYQRLSASLTRNFWVGLIDPQVPGRVVKSPTATVDFFSAGNLHPSDKGTVT
jgi:hypothetical protein